MTMEFQNKIVIVTGASAGIGANACLYFAEKLASIVLVGRNIKALEDVARKCEQNHGVKALVVKADITNDIEVKSIVTKTVDIFGRIDVLVNNAGVGVMADVTDGVEFYDKAMNTNIRSAYHLTSLAVPYLIESKGSIVNVSSVAGMKPIGELKFLAYGMSKAAMDHFTKYLALDLGPYGVRVNSVNPGATKTDFISTAGLKDQGVMSKFCATKLPLGKMAESHEVADLIVYLASDRARSITGSIFVIDNGESLK
ncbi:uncharacterized oxidoreductase TM_0325-like [Aricia agestis]|uniref:uncharacterized oxidoreductase TM_0325-like n=1 Tax=Aricia agestis TaxID=91739 RepID=UPI001C206482|nr:uncharacterized oxidoreductase TM_0325-like [Aricia agestis]